MTVLSTRVCGITNYMDVMTIPTQIISGPLKIPGPTYYNNPKSKGVGPEPRGETTPLWALIALRVRASQSSEWEISIFYCIRRMSKKST